MAKKKNEKKETERPRGGFKASRHAGHKASAAGPKAEQKRAAEERESAGVRHESAEKSKYLRGPRIDPKAIDGSESAADLIDNAFLAYNAARLR